MSRPPRAEEPTKRRGELLLRRGGLAVIAAVLVITGVLVVLPATGSDPASRDRATSGAVDGDDAQAGDGGEAVEEASPTPDVAFEQFDSGQPARLEDWRGEPVVVNFWASWCPPCVSEMRDAFEPVHQDLGDRVTFLGVNLQDTRAAADEVIGQTGVTYELARDPDGELFTAFGGFGMPTTALVDEQGNVVASHTGAVTRGQLEAMVTDHLLDS